MTSMGQDTHTVVLRRVGWALMALFALQMWMFVMTLVWYTGRINFSINMVVIFGAASLLLQNSLRTAVFVRWMAVFLAVTALGALLHSWWRPPLGLIKAQWMFNAQEVRADLYTTLFNVIVCLWVARELSQHSLMEVLSRQWRRSLDLRIAAGAGVVAAMASALALHLALNSSEQAKAHELALAQLPAGYQVHMAHIKRLKGQGQSTVSAVVWAWTESDLKRVQVRWTSSD